MLFIYFQEGSLPDFAMTVFEPIKRCVAVVRDEQYPLPVYPGDEGKWYVTQINYPDQQQ